MPLHSSILFPILLKYRQLERLVKLKKRFEARDARCLKESTWEQSPDRGSSEAVRLQLARVKNSISASAKRFCGVEQHASINCLY